MGRADHFVGTRSFNSSNQFMTTCICGATAAPAAMAAVSPALAQQNKNNQ
jgi:hypothetical protein